MIALRVERIGLEPCEMAKFKGDAAICGQRPEECFEPFGVFLRIRRKLEKDRPELLLQRFGRLHEVLGRLFDVVQSFDMGDAMRRLYRELERVRRLFEPAFQNLRLGQPVEGVVDFHAWQPL
jgi:hypothetical protein